MDMGNRRRPAQLRCYFAAIPEVAYSPTGRTGVVRLTPNMTQSAVLRSLRYSHHRYPEAEPFTVGWMFDLSVPQEAEVYDLAWRGLLH